MERITSSHKGEVIRIIEYSTMTRQKLTPASNSSFMAPGSPASRGMTLLLAVIIALQTGCAVPLPTNKSVNLSSLGNVRVIASTQEPQFKFGMEASKAAGQTADACAIAPVGGGQLGAIIFAPFYIASLACLAVGPPLSALSAASTNSNGAQIKETVFGAMDAKIIQEALRDSIVAAGSDNGSHLLVAPSNKMPEASNSGDYRALAAVGVDTVLEVAVTNIGLEKEYASSDAPLALVMKAQARLLSAHDNSELSSWESFFRGKQLRQSEWFANQAVQLVQELRAGIKWLGNEIHDDAFLLYPYPERTLAEMRRLTTGAFGIPEWRVTSMVFGLIPIEPRGERDNFFPVVYSLRPTFQWESFPRPADVKLAPAEMGRIMNVRYDLAIYRMSVDEKKLKENKSQVPSLEFVYRRNGLPSTKYTLDNYLEPDTRYSWSVRARFELDGRLRVTEWSFGRLDYNFITPDLPKIESRRND